MHVTRFLECEGGKWALVYGPGNSIVFSSAKEVIEALPTKVSSDSYHKIGELKYGETVEVILQRDEKIVSTARVETERLKKIQSAMGVSTADGFGVKSE
jgi:hypothetical protein